MKLTIEEYEELGEKIKEVYAEVQVLIQIISEKTPKNVHRRGIDKIIGGFTSLKSDLDDRLFAEHRDEDTERRIKVFYGPKETKKDE